MPGWMTYKVVSDLRTMVRRGDALAGGRLPSERELANMLCVSRGTVRSALAVMREAGEIETRTGKDGGTFITKENPSWALYSQVNVSLGSHKLIDHPMGTPQGTVESIVERGQSAHSKVISLVRAKADREARLALELDEGEEIYELVRLRSTNAAPIALEKAQLPVKLFPDLPEHNVASSLYTILEDDYNVHFSSITDSIEMVYADEDQAERLNVPEGFPLFLAVNTARGANGVPVEHSRDYYRPDAVRFVMTRDLDGGVDG